MLLAHGTATVLANSIQTREIHRVNLDVFGRNIGYALVLNSFIAFSRPSVTMDSSAWEARLIICFNSSSSCARNLVRMKFTTTLSPSGFRKAPEAVEGDTPIRMRVNFFV